MKEYYSQDITFCLNSKCKNTKCERNPCHIRWDIKPYHSFADLDGTEYCPNRKEKPTYHTVTKDESVPQGMTMYKLSKELGVNLGGININDYIGYATLHIIAKKYGVSAMAIAIYNNITKPSEFIPVGMCLKIPPKRSDNNA